MFRKLLFIILLLCTTNCIAQQATTPGKTPEKKPEQPVDYKLMGSAMPGLRMLKYHDTSGKNEAKSIDTIAAPGTRAQKRKKRQEEKMRADNMSIGSEKYITDKDLDNGANLFVMMFNPTCSHCQDETQLIEKNSSLFKRSKFLLLANPSMSTYLPNFVRNFHVSEYPVFFVGIDSSDFINKVYLYSALPQINIYNKERKLVKTFSGEVVIDSLRDYIQ